MSYNPTRAAINHNPVARSIDRPPPQDRCKRKARPRCAAELWELDLAEHFRGGHPGADTFELFNRDAVEAALAAGFLDSPDYHAADEYRNLLHPLGGRIVPGNRRRRFAAVFDRRPAGRLRGG